jgi:choline dehydrogenase-like flavoprotein
MGLHRPRRSRLAGGRRRARSRARRLLGPPWRSARGRATYATGGDTASTTGRSTRSWPPPRRWRTRRTATTRSTGEADRSRSGPSLRGFIDAAAADGFPVVADFNGPDPGGVGGYPVNVIEDVRKNAGLVHLTAEVRNRPNLEIAGDVLVDRVLFEGVRSEWSRQRAPRSRRAR